MSAPRTIFYPALYSQSKGPVWCWEQPRTQRLFNADPGGVIIHYTPAWLVSNGERLTNRIRVAHHEIEVAWAVTGDSDGPDPRALWIKAGKAAEKCRVVQFELNCEAGWKGEAYGKTLGDRNSLANFCLVDLAMACPSLELSVTAYREPTQHTSIHPTATGLLWPCRGLIGPGSPAKAYYSQMYGRTGKSAEARAVADFEEGQKIGIIRNGLELLSYLPSSDFGVSDFVRVATKYRRVRLWDAQPGHISEETIAGVKCVSELAKRGFTGPNAVRDFQLQNGLEADNLAGWRETLPALGITH